MLKGIAFFGQKLIKHVLVKNLIIQLKTQFKEHWIESKNPYLRAVLPLV